MPPSRSTPGEVKKRQALEHSPPKLLEAPKNAAEPLAPEAAGHELADLKSIRTMLTCTICDQLLYEPWTLACGHTYCYSCLSSWFVVDKHKKTCPECRKAVKKIPAPSFLIKQLVEVVMRQTALMPAGETFEQHILRRDEENQMVEADKAGDGLFKGAFTAAFRSERLFWDETDGVERCRYCDHEYTGGPACVYCGTLIDFGDSESRDFSDSVDEVLEAVDLDADLDEIDDAIEDATYWQESSVVDDEAEDDSEPHLPLPQLGRRRPDRNLPNRRRTGRAIEVESSEDSDPGSLEDFIDDDSSPQVRRSNVANRDVIHIADDADEAEDSDEGGAIFNGRRRRRPRPPSVITVDSTTGSEGGDSVDDTRLRNWGWSPLDQGQESDSESQPFVQDIGSEESDTNTMVGNHISDDEVDVPRSSTPRFYSSGNLRAFLSGRHRTRRRQATVSNTSAEEGEADDDDSGEEASGLDRDGDVEMSVSPTTSSDGAPTRARSDFRAAVALDDPDDDSSDASVRPANRRRRHATVVRHARTPDYDPRISRLFARHQSDLRDVTALRSSSFEDWDASPATARPRAGGPSYRVPPPCPSPLQRSRSPMLSITISGARRNRPRRGNYA